MTDAPRCPRHDLPLNRRFWFGRYDVWLCQRCHLERDEGPHELLENAPPADPLATAKRELARIFGL
jgi:hypothetical protein